MKHPVLLAIATALAISLFTGCKSDDEKFCAKLKEIDAEQFEDCEDDALPEVKKMCGDKFGEAVECIEEISSEDAAEVCVRRICAD